jgi:hypothetical protein
LTGAGLGLLVAPEVDPALAEESLGFGRYLEGLAGQALRGELEDVGPVGVEPQLGDQASPILGRREPQLEDIDRTKRRQCVERQPLGSALLVEPPLLLREQLAHRAVAEERLPNAWTSECGRERGGAHEPARQGIDLWWPPFCVSCDRSFERASVRRR